MFDTNVFNHLLDGKIDRGIIPRDWRIIGTHIQKDELKNTRDQRRREELISIFSEFVEASVPTESAVWGVSKFGESKYSSDDGLFKNIKGCLDKTAEKPNNNQDALIAETCIKNKFVLVTNDAALKEAITNCGGKVIDLVIR